MQSKTFVQQYADATIKDQVLNKKSYYQQTYGMSKDVFENNLNTGIAQSILGITKPWNNIKHSLLEKVSRK